MADRPGLDRPGRAPDGGPLRRPDLSLHLQLALRGQPAARPRLSDRVRRSPGRGGAGPGRAGRRRPRLGHRSPVPARRQRARPGAARRGAARRRAALLRRLLRRPPRRPDPTGQALLRPGLPAGGPLRQPPVGRASAGRRQRDPGADRGSRRARPLGQAHRRAAAARRADLAGAGCDRRAARARGQPGRRPLHAHPCRFRPGLGRRRSRIARKPASISRTAATSRPRCRRASASASGPAR